MYIFLYVLFPHLCESKLCDTYLGPAVIWISLESAGSINLPLSSPVPLFFPYQGGRILMVIDNRGMCHKNNILNVKVYNYTSDHY